MLYNKEFTVDVPFPVRNMEESGIICTSEIVTCLLKLLKAKRVVEEYGYFLSVTELISIGRGLQNYSSHINFPVRFRCRSFIPEWEDAMIGIVCRMSRTGVYLQCGPVEAVYLSVRKMRDYSYVEGNVDAEEKPLFLNNDQSRIELDSVICYKVFAARWGHVGRTRQMMVLATIEGSSLGPVQSAGSDAEDLETVYADYLFM